MKQFTQKTTFVTGYLKVEHALKSYFYKCFISCQNTNSIKKLISTVWYCLQGILRSIMGINYIYGTFPWHYHKNIYNIHIFIYFLYYTQAHKAFVALSTGYLKVKISLTLSPTLRQHCVLVTMSSAIKFGYVSLISSCIFMYFFYLPVEKSQITKISKFVIANSRHYVYIYIACLPAGRCNIASRAVGRAPYF